MIMSYHLITMYDDVTNLDVEHLSSYHFVRELERRDGVGNAAISDLLGFGLAAVRSDALSQHQVIENVRVLHFVPQRFTN
jgi:hypothetical protein